jgi:hypothetical protein
VHLTGIVGPQDIITAFANVFGDLRGEPVMVSCDRDEAHTIGSVNHRRQTRQLGFLRDVEGWHRLIPLGSTLTSNEQSRIRHEPMCRRA